MIAIKERKDKFLTNKVLQTISKICTEQNQQAFAIGGCVRDLFLNRLCKDIDIVVLGSGIELAEKTAQALGVKNISIFKNFGTAMFKYKQTEYEFVGARKESYSRNSRKPIVENGTLEDDQNRRDFTINALAIALHKDNFGEIVDSFEGIKDLEQKLIQTPLDPLKTFSDDPLRMMRAIRFATQLNFEINNETLEAISSMKERIKIISKERINDELNKIILSPVPSVGFKLLEKTGLLKFIFPELDAMKGIEVINERRHKDNFLHTIQVLDNISPKTKDLWLRWAALLHDIAKPQTKRFIDNAWTFHGHEFLGSKMIPRLFKKMRLPLNEKMKYVQKLVSLHHRPIVLTQDDITDSAVRRLLFDAGDDIDDLMTLAEADITSKQDERVQRYLRKFQYVRKKLIEIEEKDKVRNWQPPISGHEIIEIFDLKPGPKVGILKNTIKEAILDGIIPNEYNAAKNFLIKEARKIELHPKK